MIRRLLDDSPAGITANDAAEACGVTRQQANRVLKRLHDMGDLVVLGVTYDGGSWVYAKAEFHGGLKDSKEVIWR